jgi:hypothetical protein
MSDIKNGREEIHHASRSAANIMETDKRHKVKVKSVLERTRSISPTAITTEVVPLEQVFTLSSTRAWGKETFLLGGFHMCSATTEVMPVLIATTDLHMLDCVLSRQAALFKDPVRTAL